MLKIFLIIFCRLAIQCSRRLKCQPNVNEKVHYLLAEERKIRMKCSYGFYKNFTLIIACVMNTK
jgi:hypothetical protein